MVPSRSSTEDEQTTNWPWWRLPLAACVPFLLAGSVLVAHGPLWAAVGFGYLSFVCVLCGVSILDALGESS